MFQDSPKSLGSWNRNIPSNNAYYCILYTHTHRVTAFNISLSVAVKKYTDKEPSQASTFQLSVYFKLLKQCECSNSYRASLYTKISSQADDSRKWFAYKCVRLEGFLLIFRYNGALVNSAIVCAWVINGKDLGLEKQRQHSSRKSWSVLH